jgi:hypothetical protein
MDIHKIQTEKLDLIGWIYNIQDISIIEKLKNLQKSVVIEKYEASLQPMSKQELVNRAHEANKSIEKNDLTSHSDLQKEVQNW